MFSTKMKDIQEHDTNETDYGGSSKTDDTSEKCDNNNTDSPKTESNYSSENESTYNDSVSLEEISSDCDIDSLKREVGGWRSDL